MSKNKPENDLGNFANHATILDGVRDKIKHSKNQQETQPNENQPEKEVIDLYDTNADFEKFKEQLAKINARIDKMALYAKENQSPNKNNTSKHFDAQQTELIRSISAVDASAQEFKKLMYLAEEYGLDPVKKEIIFIKGRDPLTTRDGMLKIANRDPQFDGIGGDAVYEGDILTKDENEAIHITYGPDHLAFNHAKLKGAFANVYRKDRSKATSVFVSMRDYVKKNNIWEQYPNAMILKVAESMALKRAFSLSGLTSKEEVDDQND